MTKVVLPRLNQTGANEWADVESNDVALREVLNGGIDNENIKAGAGITAEKMASSIGSTLKGFQAGVKQLGSDMSLTTAYADLSGAKLEIVPTVESKLYVYMVVRRSAGTSVVTASLKLDSNAEETVVAEVAPGASSSEGATAAQVYELTLSAASHTVQMRAKRGASGSGSATAAAGSSRFAYLLLAA
jgi:hypothetical protein